MNWRQSIAISVCALHDLRQILAITNMNLKPLRDYVFPDIFTSVLHYFHKIYVIIYICYLENS